MITWDIAYESEPTNASYVFALDNDIRELKDAIRERFEKEHIWKIGDTDGQHIPGKIRVLLVGTKASIIASSGFSGAFGFASDTKELLRCTADGVFWSVIDLDHTYLSGIVDDDHTIYLKADGTRNLSEDISAGSKKITTLATPTSSGDLSTKKYADDLNATLLKNVLYQVSATSLIQCDFPWTTILTMQIAINNSEDKVRFSSYAWAKDCDTVEVTSACKITLDGTAYAYGIMYPISSTSGRGKTFSLSAYKTGIGVGNHTVNLQVYSYWGYGGSTYTNWYDRALQAYIVRKN